MASDPVKAQDERADSAHGELVEPLFKKVFPTSLSVPTPSFTHKFVAHSMKLFLLCQYYPPEIGAPQARLSEMAGFWVSAGHEVTVLTGFPNHPKGVIPKEYRGLYFQEEKKDGVTIWRHWFYTTANEGFVKRTLSHLSFMMSCMVLSLFRGEKPDCIVVSSPTFFVVASAWIFSIFRRVPFIFEVRDLWPGIFIELGVLKNRFLIQILESFEMFFYRRSKHVVTVTEGFKQNIHQRGISESKISVITNGVDLKRFHPGEMDWDFRKKWGIAHDTFVLLYAGAHGISQDLDKVLDAAKLLQEMEPRAFFLFVGEGSEKARLMERASEKIKNTLFLGGQPRETMPRIYRMANLCLVSLKNISGFRAFIPSKMFEIMACGKPILAALEGESALILNRSGGAVVTTPGDPSILAERISELMKTPERLKTMGENARVFVSAHYDRDTLAKKYLEVIEKKLR